MKSILVHYKLLILAYIDSDLTDSPKPIRNGRRSKRPYRIIEDESDIEIESDTNSDYGMSLNQRNRLTGASRDLTLTDSDMEETNGVDKELSIVHHGIRLIHRR